MSERKARYKTTYVDEFGREVGKDTSGGRFSSYREPSRQEDSAVPRSESFSQDAPRRSSTASKTHYVGSSRHGNTERSGRESNAFNARPQLHSDHGDRGQLIAINHGGSKRYYDDEEFNQPQDSTLDPIGSYEMPKSSRPRHGSQRTYNTQQSRNRDAELSPDRLPGSLANMTMDEVVQSPRYDHDILGGSDNYDAARLQLPPLIDLNQNLQIGSYGDKGKSVATDPLPASASEGIPKHLIRGTRGQTEELDSSYAKRSTDYKKFFRPGRVFSTLWTESYDGDAQSENDQFMSKVGYQISYKQKVFSKIRRFVVVRQADRSCTCLPVTTYDGRGYKKKGINLDDHGLIYSSRDPPAPIRGITKEPLRILLSKGAEKLANPSYLNYGRVYTVETNVKVKDVGDLDTESRRLLRAYYREVHFRDFPDEDNYAPPGSSSNPQQSGADVVGAGVGLSQQQSDSSGLYGQSIAGGYNQQHSWSSVGGFTPPASSLYPAAPMYPQAQPTVPGPAPTYQYATVPAFDINQRSTDHQSDFRYSQNHPTASSFSSRPVPAGRYTQDSDPRWAQEPLPQALYQTATAPVDFGSLYDRRYQGYNDQRPTDNSHYLLDPHQGQSQWMNQGAGWPSAERQNMNEEEVTLPTFEEASAQSRSRRESRITTSFTHPERPRPVETRNKVDRPPTENNHRERPSRRQTTTTPRSAKRADLKPVIGMRDNQAQQQSSCESKTLAHLTHDDASYSASESHKSIEKDRPATISISPQTASQIEQCGSPTRAPPEIMSPDSSQHSNTDAFPHKENRIVEPDGTYGTDSSESSPSKLPLEPDTFAGRKAKNASMSPLMPQDNTNLSYTEVPEPGTKLGLASTVTRPITQSKSIVDLWLGGSTFNDESTPLDVAPKTETKYTILRRSSSTSSVVSIESLIFSRGASVSSCSSLASQQDGAERLITLLLGDEQLKALYAVAAQRVSPRKFQENFRRCLIQCSVHLKAEAAMETTTSQAQSLQCARAIRLYSRQAAIKIGSTLESQETHPDTDDRESDSARSDDSDSDGGLEFADGAPTSDAQNKTGKSEADELEGTMLTLETILMSSVAFRLMKENLALFLQPDPVKKALFRSWPIDRPRDTALNIEYTVSWMLPSFIESGFPAGQELKSVMVLSGQMSNAQAQSCGEYLVASWPECGSLLLDVIQDLIRGIQNVQKQNEHVIFGVKAFDAVALEQHSRMNISVTAVHAIHEKVASAIAWLAASLRPSPHAHVVSSSVSITASQTKSGGNAIEVRLNDLEEFPEAQYSCWHPLFPHAVIAKGFPIRERAEGKGLEISFSDMALLGQSLSIVEYDGGLVLEGLRSFLIPVALYADGSVQWHFEYKRLGQCRKPRKLYEVMRQKHLVERYRTSDVDGLFRRRCFLGWTDDVQVLIGTESFSSRKLGWSGAEAGQVTGHIKSHGITTGTEGLGIFGITANRTWIPHSAPSRFTLPQNKDISDTLDDDYDANILVYDTGAKIAHVLPQVDVVLFVAHKIVKRRQYELFNRSQATTLKFASRHTTAFDIIRTSLNLRMVKTGSSDEKTLGDIIKEIWNSLDMIQSALISNEHDLALIGKGAPKFLHGVEFCDFEGMKRTMGILHVEVNEPWVHLAISEPMMPVLFCQKLGHPIVPTCQTLLCRPWTKVPNGRNYMVVTCTAVCSWLDRHEDAEKGSRLGEKIEWRVRHNAVREGLIHCHNHKESKIVYHEQQLSFATNASFNPRIHELVENCGKGGLIFGSSKIRKGCSMKLDLSTGTHSQVQSVPSAQSHSIQPTHSNMPPMPEVPEGSSDTSVENETSSATDHLSSPLSLSVSNSSQGNHYLHEHDDGPCHLIEASDSTVDQSESVRESTGDSSSQSTRGNQAVKSIPRSLKKMKKSSHLHAVHNGQDLDID